MSRRTRRPPLTAAQTEMLQAADETGYPFSAGYSGGRVNVFRALVRAGYLSDDGALTETGRAALGNLRPEECLRAKPTSAR